MDVIISCSFAASLLPDLLMTNIMTLETFPHMKV